MVVWGQFVRPSSRLYAGNPIATVNDCRFLSPVLEVRFDGAVDMASSVWWTNAQTIQFTFMITGQSPKQGNQFMCCEIHTRATHVETPIFASPTHQLTQLMTTIASSPALSSRRLVVRERVLAVPCPAGV